MDELGPTDGNLWIYVLRQGRGGHVARNITNGSNPGIGLQFLRLKEFVHG